MVIALYPFHEMNHPGNVRTVRGFLHLVWHGCILLFYIDIAKRDYTIGTPINHQPSTPKSPVSTTLLSFVNGASININEIDNQSTIVLYFLHSGPPHQMIDIVKVYTDAINEVLFIFTHNPTTILRILIYSIP